MDPELYRYVVFGTKMIHLPQIIFFFRKTINSIFMYLLVPYILQNFKKILGADSEL